jgi:hypothetical protein
MEPAFVIAADAFNPGESACGTTWPAGPTVVRLLDLVAQGTQAPGALPKDGPFPKAHHFAYPVLNLAAVFAGGAGPTPCG